MFAFFCPREGELSVAFTGSSRFYNADTVKNLFFQPGVDLGGKATMGFLGDTAVASFNKTARNTALAAGVTKEAFALIGDVAKGGISGLGKRRDRRMAEDAYYECLLGAASTFAREGS